MSELKVGDVINPNGVFDLPLRVMKIIGDQVITVHLAEWKALRTDNIDRYATVHAIKRSVI